MTIININKIVLGGAQFFWLEIIRNNAYKNKGFRLKSKSL